MCRALVNVRCTLRTTTDKQVLIDLEMSVQGLRELMLMNVKLESLPKLVLLTRGRPLGECSSVYLRGLKLDRRQQQ